MTLLKIPEAKVPDRALPTIRLPIHIPHIGCPGADGRSYLGEQFGSLPDLYDAIHTKHLRKVINDQIYTLLKGKLPTILRAALYAQKALALIQEVTEIVAVLNQVIGQAIAEYTATIGFINQKIGELNQAIADINSRPSSSRRAVHQLALERYQEYVGELDQQITRLQTSIMCIAE